MAETRSSINGPVVTVRGKTGFSMMEMVYVGKARLVGEVIRLSEDAATIQVYEETGGLAPGEPVYSTGGALAVTLGPGILRNIYDGIQRPLPALEELSGAFIGRGCSAPALDETARWEVTVLAKPGDRLTPGQIYATCPETPAIEHRCMVPPNVSGTVTWVAKNSRLYTVNDTVVNGPPTRPGQRAGADPVPEMAHPNPPPGLPPMPSPAAADRRHARGGRHVSHLRQGRRGCHSRRLRHRQDHDPAPAGQMVRRGHYHLCGLRRTRQRDDPGADRVQRANHPKTGRPLTDRTVLIANTSNMPVAARKASIYTGITLAESYRDMGYHAAMMADSTSRWAEALREISGRLEEMPADEGYPAYLPSRLAQFYERAGYAQALCGQEGSVTVIGAVSPPGLRLLRSR